ncbi:MAG: 2OG-Fe(II) oxygenase [Pseudomonadales bacterium]|nr:2OG-Fe(II) oxygenase [Pseudomonadales bacterium]
MMTLPDSSPGADAAVLLDAVADALVASGWGVFPMPLPTETVLDLLQQARSTADYHEAGIGRQGELARNVFVRRDEVAWIDGEAACERAWVQWLETLRVHLNRTLMLGADQFETHYAHYPPGAFYRRHLDAFRGETNRRVTVVAYLNAGWMTTDGGELVLYSLEGGDEVVRIPPRFGSVAIFLSEQFPHEVLPTRAHRYSLTAWLRVRDALPLNA